MNKEYGQLPSENKIISKINQKIIGSQKHYTTHHHVALHNPCEPPIIHMRTALQRCVEFHGEFLQNNPSTEF